MFKKKNTAGFTLYELLISISVVVVLTGIVMYNHKRFETDIEVSNLAYKLGLIVREAQTNSISVKQFGDDGRNFDTSYGLHFDKYINDEFIVFTDLPEASAGVADGLYTRVIELGGVGMDCESSECVEKISLGRGNKIKSLCAIYWADGNPSQSEPCIEMGGGGNYGFLDIRFKRPNPDAILNVYNEGDYTPGQQVTVCDGETKSCSGWAICLVSPQGRNKRVSVYQTGQISVENVEEGGVCST